MLTPEKLQQLIGRDDPVILDIGCNDGENTEGFLDLFPGASLFCFEPDPRAIQRFRSRVTSPRARLFEIALGAWNDEYAVFYQSGGWPSLGYQQELPQGWDFSGSIHRPARHLSMHPWCTFERKTPVVVRRLDTWAKEYGIEAADFIWADVQGAEGDLIAGGGCLLAETRYFYTEYSDRELYEGQPTLEQLRTMVAPSFEVVQIWEEDVLFRNRRFE